MQTQSLSLARYYFHFAWMYAVVSLALLGLVSLYEWWSGKALGSNVGSSMAVLIASAYFVAHKFVVREGRAPEGGEVHRLVWASAGITVAWSCLFLFLVFFFVFEGDLLLGLEVLQLELSSALLVVVGGVALVATAFAVGLFYLIYGRAARKVAARLQARAAA